MIRLEAVFRRRSDVRFRRLPPEGVVVRQTDPEVLVVNDLGARILEKVDGTTTVATMVDAFALEYDVDAGVLAADVVTFLEELQASGIIEGVGDGG